jgi:hypothetical protein
LSILQIISLEYILRNGIIGRQNVSKERTGGKVNGKEFSGGKEQVTRG